MDLITPAFVTSRLPGLPANRSAAVPSLVTAASAMILHYVRRPLFAQDYDETYRIGPRNVVRLHYPVQSISTIEIDKSPINLVNDPESYRIDKPAGLLYLPYGIEARVVYRAGYDVIPTQIQEAAFLLVQAMLDNLPGVNASESVTSTGALTSVRLGDYSESYATNQRSSLELSSAADGGLPPTVRNLLMGYRDDVGESRRW